MAPAPPALAWDDALRRELAQAVATGRGSLGEHFLLHWVQAGVYGAVVLILAVPTILLGRASEQPAVVLLGAVLVPLGAAMAWGLRVRSSARREGGLWTAELLMRQRGLSRSQRREIVAVLRATCRAQGSRPSTGVLVRELEALTPGRVPG